MKEIGKEIKQGYESDDSSRAEWLDKHTYWMTLYNQSDYAENGSSERDWGATESVPILTEACNQFQSRTFKTFFPNALFVEAVPNRLTKDPMKQMLLKDRAERIGRHMSFQLGVQNKDYKRDKSALFLGLAVHGSMFTKTYFDAYRKKRVCIDNIRPTDLVINYTCGPIRIENVRRKSHVINTTVGETKQLMQKYYFIDAAKPDLSGNKSQYDTTVDQIQGIQRGSHTVRMDEPATLIEQHFYLDLQDDGNFLPYIGTIDLSTGRLLRLTIGYEADPMGNPLKDYEQLQYFEHYKFMENPDGFYGLGLGHMLGDLNGAINIGTRQVMDAATLATDGNSSGFISERMSEDQGDEIALTLGKFRKVSATVEDLNKSIMTMKFPGPNETQIKLLEWLDARAQRLGSTTEATTGAIDTNRQPTTVLAQIEQSLELFSSVQMNIQDSLTGELEKVYKLNQKFLPLIDYFVVNDVTDSITRMDYSEDMMIRPIFDPKFSTRQQKIARAQAEWQAVMENPLSQSRPWVYDIATRRRLEAMGADNIDELVPPTPMEQYAAITQQQQAAQQQATAQSGATSPMAGGQLNPMGNGTGQGEVSGMAPIA